MSLIVASSFRLSPSPQFLSSCVFANLLHVTRSARNSASGRNIMRPMSSLTLFSSCVSILILQPLVLAALMISAPQLAVRQNQNVASICGYYSLNGRMLNRFLSVHAQG